MADVLKATMMCHKDVLFIGGPWDGQRKPYGDSPPSKYVVAAYGEPNTVYQLHLFGKLKIEERKHWECGVYALPGVDDYEVLIALIDNYAQPAAPTPAAASTAGPPS